MRCGLGMSPKMSKINICQNCNLLWARTFCSKMFFLKQKIHNFSKVSKFVFLNHDHSCHWLSPCDLFNKIFSFGFDLKSPKSSYFAGTRTPYWGAQIRYFPHTMASVGFFSETGWRRKRVPARATWLLLVLVVSYRGGYHSCTVLWGLQGQLFDSTRSSRGLVVLSCSGHFFRHSPSVRLPRWPWHTHAST